MSRRAKTETQRKLDSFRGPFGVFFEALNRPVVLLDGAGSTVESNPAYDDLFDGPTENRLVDLFAGRQSDDLRKIVQKLLDGRSQHETVAVYPVTDTDTQNWYTLELQSLDCPEGERPTAILCRLNKDSRRREAELREARDQAQLATAQKSRFLANASHDLRQPLQAVTLLVDVLKEEELSEASRPLVDRLDRGVTALDNLLKDVLDYSKLEAGVAEPKIESISLSALFLKLYEELETQALTKNLFLRYVDTSLCVASDPAMLEAILRNLLGNAVKYTEKGGVLWGCRRRGEELEIQILDSGVGINKKHRRRVFMEYQRISDDRAESGDGLGLGLAVVREAARALNHKLRLVSEENRGSKFSVFVPIVDCKGARFGIDQPMPYLPQRTGDATVLVIDDEPSICEVMALTLNRLGYTTLTAHSGAQAMSVIAEADAPPDVIVVDYALSHGETGPMAIEQIFEALGCSLPVLMITGETDPSRLREVLSLGWPVLHKPIKAREIGAKLAKLTARKSD